MTEETKARQAAVDAKVAARRAELLARARAATANDPPQVVGYTEAELAKRAETLGMIERLIALRALWSREDRELAARRAVIAGGERAPVLPPAPPVAWVKGWDLDSAAGVSVPLPPPPPPEPAPADDAPQTMRSEGCGLEPPPDTHQPFPLVRVRVPGVPHSRARPSHPGSAPQPPTEPRRQPAAPPGPTRLERLAARWIAPLQGLLWAGACGW